MILRHCREAGEAASTDDTFEAIDERTGKKLGKCVILVVENETLFPARPVRIYIDISGEDVPDAVLGAAVARAKEVARSCGKPARVFTSADADATEFINSLAVVGLKDNDGIVIMKRDLESAEIPLLPEPAGCVLVEDKLEDDMEKKFFLERYNMMYGEEKDMDWVEAYTAQDEFMRLLIISRNGVAGELVCWKDGENGVIDWFNVPQKWRNMGIGGLLIDLACDRMKNRGIKAATCEIQVRIPYVLHMLEKREFKQEKLVRRYPGADVDLR